MLNSPGMAVLSGYRHLDGVGGNPAGAELRCAVQKAFDLDHRPDRYIGYVQVEGLIDLLEATVTRLGFFLVLVQRLVANGESRFSAPPLQLPSKVVGLGVEPQAPDIAPSE